MQSCMHAKGGRSGRGRSAQWQRVPAVRNCRISLQCPTTKYPCSAQPQSIPCSDPAVPMASYPCKTLGMRQTFGSGNPRIVQTLGDVPVRSYLDKDFWVDPVQLEQYLGKLPMRKTCRSSSSVETVLRAQLTSKLNRQTGLGLPELRSKCHSLGETRILFG